MATCQRQRKKCFGCVKATYQVCVQHPTSTDNVAPPAFAAERRAAARLLLDAGPPAVQQSIDISWQPGPQQQTSATANRERKCAANYNKQHNKFIFQTAVSILVIYNHDSFRVLFDKIAFACFITKIHL